MPIIFLGLDISGTMIGLATGRLEPWQDRVEVQRADGTPSLSLLDASFDRFLATYVFDLLDPAYSERLIAEAHRVLIPGGLLCTINLTHGTGRFSWFVSWLWSSACDRWPRLVEVAARSVWQSVSIRDDGESDTIDR